MSDKSFEQMQTVVFRLGDEHLGIEIFRVHEIIRMREITPIPRSEPHVRGLINLRGKTIPVVDLRVRLSLDSAEETETSRIIVVAIEEGQVGVIVDGVSEVITINEEEVEEAPTLVSEFDTSFVAGIAKRTHHLVTLLNLDQALAA